MSEMSIDARKANKAKAERITRGDPHAKVDASDFVPPEQLETTAKTGLRPISLRQFKRGGKVEGDQAKMHAGKKPRKAGGRLVDDFVNADVRSANKARDGIKHVGGFKRGGGLSVSDGAMEGTRPTGGRLARKDGGRAGKGKMNVNIIIGAQHDPSQQPMGGGQPQPMSPPPHVPIAPPPQAGQGMPPMPMGAGAPPPMPPQMPPQMPPPGMMGRKSGGRTMHAGAGSGLGRLEKAEDYGHRA